MSIWSNQNVPSVTASILTGSRAVVSSFFQDNCFLTKASCPSSGHFSSMQVTPKLSFTLRWIVRVFPALNGLSLCWVCFLTVYSFIVCFNSVKPLMFWHRAELSASKLHASILCTVCQKANDCLKTSKVMQMLIQLCDSFVQEGGLLWVLICNSSNTCLTALDGNINMCSTTQNA